MGRLADGGESGSDADGRRKAWNQFLTMLVPLIARCPVCVPHHAPASP